jgi:hypothetical protein
LKRETCVQIFNLFEDKHFRGFFTSEKMMCVKSIFYIFLTPIAYMLISVTT